MCVCVKREQGRARERERESEREQQRAREKRERDTHIYRESDKDTDTETVRESACGLEVVLRATVLTRHSKKQGNAKSKRQCTRQRAGFSALTYSVGVDTRCRSAGVILMVSTCPVTLYLSIQQARGAARKSSRR